MGELAGADRTGAQPPRRAELGAIEPVAARVRLVDDAVQVQIDRGQRIGEVAEPRELRVVAVAAGRAAQHGTREQTLAPQRDQAAGVEVTWVDRPEPHATA